MINKGYLFLYEDLVKNAGKYITCYRKGKKLNNCFLSKFISEGFINKNKYCILITNLDNGITEIISDEYDYYQVENRGYTNIKVKND